MSHSVDFNELLRHRLCLQASSVLLLCSETKSYKIWSGFHWGGRLPVPVAWGCGSRRVLGFSAFLKVLHEEAFTVEVGDANKVSEPAGASCSCGPHARSNVIP